jgi:hypothetical protein
MFKGLRWEDSIKMDFQEVGRGHELNSTSSENGQVADACECGYEFSVSIKYGKFLTRWETVSFSRRILPSWRF